jgi:hypothetical protein
VSDAVRECKRRVTFCSRFTQRGFGSKPWMQVVAGDQRGTAIASKGTRRFSGRRFTKSSIESPMLLPASTQQTM